jgi:DNA-binding protein HU-beta
MGQARPQETLMTKQEFIDAVAERSGLSRAEASKAVDAVLATITDTLKRRGSINFTGFGKFATSPREARMGVNPRNPGEKVHIPAATVPKFTAGRSLKSAVRSGRSSRSASRDDVAASLPGEPGVPWDEEEE